MKSESAPLPPTTGARNYAWLVAGVSLAFVLLLWPYHAAVFWAIFMAIVFMPMHRVLRHRMRPRDTLAALVSVTVIFAIVIFPLVLVGISVSQEISSLAARARTGELDLDGHFSQLFDIMPGWAQQWMERAGISDLRALQRWLSGVFGGAENPLSERLVEAGQMTLQWAVAFMLMLYLLFFLLRDGDHLSARVVRAVPLEDRHKLSLAVKFVDVVRATVMGTAVVAVAQGVLGAAAFMVLGIGGALLWGALMAMLSLLPAIGSAFVWGPFAIYLMATGNPWQGAALALWGILVIGLVDNLLRPFLVARRTHIPDYVVLTATIGGLAWFGISGFVYGPVIAAVFLAAWDVFTRERGDMEAPAVVAAVATPTQTLADAPGR